MYTSARGSSITPAITSATSSTDWAKGICRESRPPPSAWTPNSVATTPGSTVETKFLVESRDDLREIKMRCTQTGMYARWLLTEAQRDTFVEVEFGMDPTTLGPRVFDMAVGRLYFRRWLEQSLDALEHAASPPAATSDRY